MTTSSVGAGLRGDVPGHLGRMAGLIERVRSATFMLDGEGVVREYVERRGAAGWQRTDMLGKPFHAMFRSGTGTSPRRWSRRSQAGDDARGALDAVTPTARPCAVDVHLMGCGTRRAHPGLRLRQLRRGPGPDRPNRPCWTRCSSSSRSASWSTTSRGRVRPAEPRAGADQRRAGVRPHRQADPARSCRAGPAAGADPDEVLRTGVPVVDAADGGFTRSLATRSGSGRSATTGCTARTARSSGCPG